MAMGRLSKEDKEKLKQRLRLLKAHQGILSDKEFEAASTDQKREIIKVKQRRAALQQGNILEQAGPTVSQTGEALVRGAAQEATLGFAPQIQAGIEEVGERIGLAEPAPFKERVQRVQEQQRRSREQAPGAFTTGQVAGTFAPAAGFAKGAQFVGKGVKASRLGQAVEKAPRAIKGPAKALGKGAALAGEVGTETALFTPLPEEGEPTSEFGVPVVDRGQQFKIGAGIGVGGPLALKAGGATLRIGKRLFGGVMGVTEDVMEKYVRRRDSIASLEEEAARRNMSPRELVGAWADEALAPLRQKARQGEIDKNEAKEVVENLRTQIQTDLNLEKQDVQAALKKSKEDLDALIARKQSVKPPTELTDPYFEAKDTLKEGIINESEKAYAILDENPDATVSFEGLSDIIRGYREKLVEAGPKTRAIRSQLEDAQELLEAAPNEVSLRDAKRWIRSFDKEVTWDPKIDFVDSDYHAALKQVRGILNRRLRSVAPESYGEIIDGIRPRAQLLEELNKKVGGESEKVEKAFRNIGLESNTNKQALIEQLGEATGFNFNEKMANYLNVKNEVDILKSKLGDKEFKRQFGEFQEFEKAQLNLEAFKQKEQLQKNALNDARARQLEANRRADELKEAVKFFDGFKEGDAHKNVEQLINVMNSPVKKEGNKVFQQFQRLSQMSDSDFVDLVDQVRVSEAFIEGNTKSDGRAFILTVLMGGGSGVVGGMAATGEAAAGGAAGMATIGAAFYLNRHGPRITKQILNSLANMKGLLTKTKINKMPIPGPAKRDLLRGYLSLLGGKALSEDASINIDPDGLASVREDIKNAEHLTPVQKSRAIRQLNETGQLSNIGQILNIKGAKPEDIAKERKAK